MAPAMLSNYRVAMPALQDLVHNNLVKCVHNKKIITGLLKMSKGAKAAEIYSVQTVPTTSCLQRLTN